MSPVSAEIGLSYLSVEVTASYVKVVKAATFAVLKVLVIVGKVAYVITVGCVSVTGLFAHVVDEVLTLVE